ncbi:hypothetical protein P7B02_00780 [Caulobacter segnis]|uniref:hypothetical protein n=1 Tax=Caulobacter segnis TaxID=88688 RepID=UPI00240F4427|nr:hypothetical protein [Caulobacter segnis]MDG2520057.1 hypothetical protein [Caulobacter segnis]
MIRLSVSLLIAASLALPAFAQETPEPAPVQAQPAQPDEDAAEAAPAPQPQIERPYEAAPPTEVGPVYDARVQGRIGAAQSQRGRLDGGWILSDQAGAPLYALQFSQTPQNGLEGAWRDLRRGGVSTLGVIDEVTEAGEGVTALLPGKNPAAPAKLTLRPVADGWSGELRDGGVAQTVSAKRDPISAAWDSFTPAASTRPFVAASTAPKAVPAKNVVKRKATAKRGKGKRRRR